VRSRAILALSLAAFVGVVSASAQDLEKRLQSYFPVSMYHEVALERGAQARIREDMMLITHDNEEEDTVDIMTFHARCSDEPDNLPEGINYNPHVSATPFAVLHLPSRTLYWDRNLDEYLDESPIQNLPRDIGVMLRIVEVGAPKCEDLPKSQFENDRETMREFLGVPSTDYLDMLQRYNVNVGGVGSRIHEVQLDHDGDGNIDAVVEFAAGCLLPASMNWDDNDVAVSKQPFRAFKSIGSGLMEVWEDYDFDGIPDLRERLHSLRPSPKFGCDEVVRSGGYFFEITGELPQLKNGVVGFIASSPVWSFSKHRSALAYR